MYFWRDIKYVYCRDRNIYFLIEKFVLLFKVLSVERDDLSTEFRYSRAWITNVERTHHPRRRKETRFIAPFAFVNQGEYISSGNTWDRKCYVYAPVKPKLGIHCHFLSPHFWKLIAFCLMILRFSFTCISKETLSKISSFDV